MELSLARPAMSLGVCAEKFGPRMHPHLSAFRNCMKLASDIAESRGDPGPLESQIGLLDDILDALPDSDVLYHHITALCSAAAAFGCVSVERPSEHLEFIVEDINTSINALQSMNDSSHSRFANAVSGVLDALNIWVKGNLHSDNRAEASASASTVLPTGTASSSKAETSRAPGITHTAPHLVAYRCNISEGAVRTFRSAADSLGGRAAEVAGPAAEALDEIYNFLVTASEMSSPPADDKKQEMIKKVVERMGTVVNLSSECPSGDNLFNHVKSVEEAMNMVSWIVATAKPVTFITDADAASSFYLNKILTMTKNAPDAASHKAFVDALKAMFSSMKEYVKEHYTMGVRYGIGVHGIQTTASDAVALEPAARDEVTGEDYVSAFKELIDGPLVTYANASKALGGVVEEQAVLLEAAWQTEAEFLAKAISTPKPSADEMQKLLAPIAGKMGCVNAIVDKVDPRGPFAQHCNAVGESVGALGWVAVEEKATAFVGDMAGAGQFFTDKVKMGAKKTNDPDQHRVWAKALESLFLGLKAYVKAHHTQSLVWNPPKRTTTSRSPAVASSSEAGDTQKDYVRAFKELLAGPLAAFSAASNVLGGEVQQQAAAFAAAWEAEAEFLANAFKTPKPDDVQEMLTPIASKMGEVGAFIEQVGPRGPFSQHCNAVGESVAALGWVAVDEKATAFVSDMAGAGQFFLDKVKMESKRTTNPESHRAWAKSLEELYAGLKAYVKEYHTQKLVWNPPKAKTMKKVSGVVETRDATLRSDYVTAFNGLITGPLAAFVRTSDDLGGEVMEQAHALATVWEAERDFLSKAITMSRPDNIDEMVSQIGARMSEVAVVVDKVGPRGTFAQHCNAVSESVGALGWVAVDEKATAYVGDIASAGQFFIDKVKMDAKKTDNASAHRAWAQALEALLADLKAYVKEYHTQRLTWKAG